MGNPLIRYESGQTAQPFEAMTDSGDSLTFESTIFPLSGAAGAEPIVAPYGLTTGGAITATANNDEVSVSALTASMAGAASADAKGNIAVSSGTVALTRASVDTHIINSITVTEAGALEAVQGSEGTAFSETRDAAGGPPLIPTTSIEIGQVRLSAQASAAVTSDEIFTVVGLHTERSDQPVFQIDSGRGTVTFADDLPLIHTGDLPKKVFLKGSTPLFAPIPNTSDWVPAESTFSINSTETYDGPVGSASSSLGQATFNAVLKDGITDAFLSKKGENLWFEFRPDRNKTNVRMLTQGIFGVSRTFPAGGGSISASCTVTPQTETLDFKE